MFIGVKLFLFIHSFRIIWMTHRSWWWCARNNTVHLVHMHMVGSLWNFTAGLFPRDDCKLAWNDATEGRRRRCQDSRAWHGQKMWEALGIKRIGNYPLKISYFVPELLRDKGVNLLIEKWIHFWSVLGRELLTICESSLEWEWGSQANC